MNIQTNNNSIVNCTMRQCIHSDVCRHKKEFDLKVSQGILKYNWTCLKFKDNYASMDSLEQPITVTQLAEHRSLERKPIQRQEKSEADMILDSTREGLCHVCKKNTKVIKCNICGEDTCLSCGTLTDNIDVDSPLGTATETRAIEQFFCIKCIDY